MSGNDTKGTIDLAEFSTYKYVCSKSNLLHNLNVIKKIISSNGGLGKIMPVLKANAYGHGALDVASMLSSHVEFMAVSSIAEAIHLRNNGIYNKILAFQGAISIIDMFAAQELSIDIAIHNNEAISLLNEFTIKFTKSIIHDICKIEDNALEYNAPEYNPIEDNTTQNDIIQNDIIEYNSILDRSAINTVLDIKRRNDFNSAEKTNQEANQEANQNEKKIIRVWIKVNLGSNRFGFEINELKKIYYQISSNPFAKVVGIIGHLSGVDKSKIEVSAEQMKDFQECVKSLKDELIKLGRESEAISLLTSLRNSCATFHFPGFECCDYPRLGIALYGGSPTLGVEPAEFDLKPVMNLKSTVLAIRRIHINESIGYTFDDNKNNKNNKKINKKSDKRRNKESNDIDSDETMLVAIIGIGYSTGYPSWIDGAIPAHINGKQCKIVGNIMMNTLFVDITNHENIKVGDEVIFYGENHPIERYFYRSAYILTSLYSNINRIWV